MQQQNTRRKRMAISYDTWLVILSIVVAIVASYVALDLASRVVASRGSRGARYWLAGGAVSMGTGIWSMHFIGMLALHLPIPMAYNIRLTLLSLLIAAIVSGFALHMVSHDTLSLRRLLRGGLLMGLGIATMHYTGMAAMEMKPGLRYNPLLFSLSVLIAIGASVAALWIAFQLRAETILSAFWRKAGSALVMGAAIAGMHYTGMAAAIFAPDSICTVSPPDINNLWLGGTIGGFAFMFLATTLLISVFDAHLANRSARHTERLRQMNTDLERQATELSQANTRLQQEVEERIRSEQRIEYLAYHDSLTDLPNRTLFSRHLNHAISQALRYRKSLAVLFIDVDRFKNINDTLGHAVGDLLLQEVARRLQRCLRSSDIVARMGGDEFVVLLEELEDGQERAESVARKILAAVASPFAASGQEFRVTASIGISLYPQHGIDEQSLMKTADVAMYAAKEDGKNNYQFYSEQLSAGAFEKLTLESSLRRALENNEFELHYQPKIDLRSNRISGVEALIRWQHPDLGTVPPTRFIPIAEESGLIVAIGRWVLRTACLQCKAWQDSGLPPLCIAVNLSARQFSDDHLLQDITASLEESGLDPMLLELEITESMLMQNVDKAMRVLGALKEMGVRVAIDDFGTGYSSLANLKRFPIDTLKIDRAFIRGIPGDTEDRGITQAIISMSRTLSLTVVAEGVETEEQAGFLREHACDQFQGFHFSRALPAAQFSDLLQAQIQLDKAAKE
jgi:diguanylate cyclase (GGDEF)-like protein